jgi:hypothetical protein
VRIENVVADYCADDGQRSGCGKLDTCARTMPSPDPTTRPGSSALNEQVERLGTIFPYTIALTYAHRGEKDIAIQWLEEAYKQHDASLLEMVGEPLLRVLYGDERFKAFLRKMKLPTDWASEASVTRGS